MRQLQDEREPTMNITPQKGHPAPRFRPGSTRKPVTPLSVPAVPSAQHRYKGKAALSKRRRVIFKFRLYVAGGTQNSAQAMENLTALCRVHLPDRHSIEVVDVFREPQRALSDGIFMTPTLLKIGPSPTQRIVGTLSPTDRLLLALGLKDNAS